MTDIGRREKLAKKLKQGTGILTAAEVSLVAAEMRRLVGGALQS